jgi:hypothetical protein
MKRYFVYIVTNQLTGMKYVGSYSNNYSKKAYFGKGRLIRDVIQKQGKENFSKTECKEKN